MLYQNQKIKRGGCQRQYFGIKINLELNIIPKEKYNGEDAKGNILI